MNKAERLTENSAPQDLISRVLYQDEIRKKNRRPLTTPIILEEEQVVCDFSISSYPDQQRVSDIIISPQFNAPLEMLESETDSGDFLAELVAEERLEATTTTWENLPASYFQSEKYKKLIQPYGSQLRMRVNDDNAFRREFAGAVFEGIAEEYFKEMFSSDRRTVIGSQRTDRFFQSQYPDKEVAQFKFGKIGLLGITVPDGMVIEDGKITHFGEFSLSKYENYYHKKHKVFTSSFVPSEVKAFYQGAVQVFVTPEDFPKNIKSNLENKYDDVEFIALPFTRYDLAYWIEDPRNHSS